MHLQKSAVKDDSAYKGLKDTFQNESDKQVTLARIAGKTSPYGAYDWLGLQGQPELSEKYTSVGTTVKNHLPPVFGSGVAESLN